MLDYANLPTTFNHLSHRQMALDVCARIQSRHNIDLAAIMSSPSLSYHEKRRMMIEALLSAKFEAEYQSGNEFFADGTDSDAADLAQVNAALAEDQDIEPNISFPKKNAAIIRDYTGSELKTYVYNLTKRFENMEVASTPGQLALEIVGGGLLSVGVPMAVQTVKAYKAMGAAAKLLPALKTGITKLGMKTAITAVVIVLVALLLYLFLENPKKILAFVVNETDHDFVVKNWKTGNGDLHMEHGHMADFMEDNQFGDLSAPKVQIQRMVDFGDGDPESFVFAGVYFANKNFGMLGAEGIMRFTSLDKSVCFAHMFAVPYFKDNGTNIGLQASQSADLSKLFRQMYNSRQTRKDIVEGGYRLTSTVNDPRGGVVAAIASISAI